MDLLRFDKKKEIRKTDEPPAAKRRRQFDGTLTGDTVVIHDSEQANGLRSYGFYGNFTNENIPSVSLECFGGQSTSTALEEEEPLPTVAAQDPEMTACEREAELWRSQCPTDNRLYLSMEESIFLADELKVLQIFSHKQEKLNLHVVWNHFLSTYGETFVQRYAVYRFFRLQKWTVRSGLSFGADFMLYREGPEKYHASAGVRIISHPGFLSSVNFIALNREMTNVKKRLIIATVEIPVGTDIGSPVCINDIIVSQMTYAFRKVDDGLT